MSISLAAWETRAPFFGKGAQLPWNRYLVRIDVPEDVWRQDKSWSTALGRLGCDSRGARVSFRICLLRRARRIARRSLGIIYEEDNVLINPRIQTRDG